MTTHDLTHCKEAAVPTSARPGDCLRLPPAGSVHSLKPMLMTILALLPALAHAQGIGGFGDGVTQLLKTMVHLIVFEWGYYLGILLLAIQGYRWKTGRCDLMELGRWGLGIVLVFFAPNIVGEFRSRAGGML